MRALPLVLALVLLVPAAAADHPGSNKGLAGLVKDLSAADPLAYNLVHHLPTVEAKFARWESEWPDLVERRTLGKTTLGHPLLNVRITDETVPFDAAPLSTGQKLRVYLDGGHHGNEFLGVELVMYYLEDLLAKAAEGDAATLELLRTTEIHATPIVNVEGNFHDSRKNSRLVDPNRNYDFHWGEEGSSGLLAHPTYRGPAAESEPEVKANADFQREIRPDMVVTMHTGIAEFYWPWGWTHEVSPDDAFFTSLEKPFEEATNGRVDAMQGAELYIVSGASDDWAYGVLGAPGFTYEVHEDQNLPVYGQPIPEIIRDQLAGLDFVVRNVTRMGAWLEAVQDGNGTWMLDNQGWGVGVNVTLLPRGGGEPVPLGVEVPPYGGRVALPGGPEAYEGWSYPVLLINATKTRTHSFGDVSTAAAEGAAPVPGPAAGLVGLAVVAVALALRRRAA